MVVIVIKGFTACHCRSKQKLMFCRLGCQCIQCTNVPLNQNTQLEYSNTNEDCESATSDEEKEPDTP